MPRLRLDYQTGRNKSALGSVMLVCGVLLATLALLQYLTLRDELAVWESKVADIRKTEKRSTSSAPRSPGVDADSQEITAARAVLERLSRPWDDLFNALESAQSDGVALLAIEPNPEQGSVKLTAEAKSDTAMLDFVDRLQAVDTLAGVALANHQIKTDDPLKAVRFAVVASWIRQP